MPTNDIIIALAPEAFPNLDKIIDAAKKDAPPLVATYLDAAKTVRGGTATFNLTGPTLLRVVLDAKDAEAAGNVEELLQQALRMASGGLVLAKQSMPKELQATLGPVVKLAEQFVDGGQGREVRQPGDSRRQAAGDPGHRRPSDRRRAHAICHGSPRRGPPGTAG